jgi:hypothetical protein
MVWEGAHLARSEIFRLLNGWGVISVEQSVESLRGLTEVIGENLPCDISYTTNPTWPDPASKPGRRRGNPATNRLSYGSAHYSGLLMACVINHKGRTHNLKRGAVANQPPLESCALGGGGGDKCSDRANSAQQVKDEPRAGVQLSPPPNFSTQPAILPTSCEIWNILK